MTGIIGKKMGMTQLFDDDGNVVAVTVVQAGPCPVTQVRTLDNDGYEAVQLAFEECKDKHISKPELGHLKKAGLKHGMRHLVEFDGVGDLKVGDTVTVEAFEDGQSVTATGVSKGKGFQGTIKRHNFGRGPETHGSHNVRAAGLHRRERVPRASVQGHAHERPHGRRARHAAGPQDRPQGRGEQPAAHQGLRAGRQELRRRHKG